MSDKTYRVVITREGENWLADVPGVRGAHTYARTLPTLDQSLREVIALVEDLPDGAEAGLDLSYEVHTGDPALDEATAKVRAERERLRAAERALSEQTERLARQMRDRWSVRDCAHLLGVSMQRVSQLAPQRTAQPGRRGVTVTRNARVAGKMLRVGRRNSSAQRDSNTKSA